MRAGYFGPEGTFTHEALIDAAGGQQLELVSFPTIYDTVMAVHDGAVERALVPIENSLEGSVNATLDALAMETEDVAIVGEVVHPIRQCLIARTEIELGEIEVVVSHPQANAQCARFIRTRLPAATVLRRQLHRRRGADGGRARRSLGGARHAGWRPSATAATCCALASRMSPSNETRFVWLARADAPARPGRGEEAPARSLEDRDRVLGSSDRRRRGGSSAACRSSRRGMST